jgi:hypothetical protein
MTKAIRSGTETSETMVAPDAIHWSVVVGLQIWAVGNDRDGLRKPPHETNVAWFRDASVRYAVVVLFEDDTWVWVDMAVSPDAAIKAAQQLAAKHDKPVRRSAQRDDQLRKRGY